MKYILSISVCLVLTYVGFAQGSLLKQAEAAKKNGQYETSYDLYKQAGEVFLEQNAILSYIETHLEMIDCMLLNGDPFHAKSLAENTLEYITSEVENSPSIKARSQTLLGLSFLNLGRNDDALENLLEAEKLFGKDDTIEKAECFNALGLVYWNNGNKTLALQYHEQALSIRRQLLEKSTGLLKMSGGGRVRKNRVCEGSGGSEAG